MGCFLANIWGVLFAPILLAFLSPKTGTFIFDVLISAVPIIIGFGLFVGLVFLERKYFLPIIGEKIGTSGYYFCSFLLAAFAGSVLVVYEIDKALENWANENFGDHHADEYRYDDKLPPIEDII